MKIYLLRHGLTSYNAEKRYQGTRDIPLSAQGESALQPADFSPERVYVSPLCRARRTADILFPCAQQHVIDDFREMCFGMFEGKTYVDMEKDPDYLAWVGEDCRGRCPGGESRQEFSDRTCAAFRRLLRHAAEQNISELVIMAHGGTQMAIMERYALPRLDYYHWCSPNAGGYVLEMDPKQSLQPIGLHLVGEVAYAKRTCPC